MEILHVIDCSTGMLAGLLYDAAMAGSVQSLDRLLEQYGRLILCRFSLTSFAETPLHLAALLGHLEFTKRLLELRPELATEQDSERCTPLHLAAANGHDQVVRELLRADEKVCLVSDQEGRVPLHLAAMKGRVRVVRELLNSTPAHESLKKKVNNDGDSILHLCVKYNHLDVLKAVLGSIDDGGDVLKMTDSRGNTVLHLAVMLKQRETVRFLLGLPRVKTEVINTRNTMEFTALDALNHFQTDCKSLEIREILIAGVGDKTVLLSRHPAIGGADLRKDEDGEVPAQAREQVQESWTLRKLAWDLVNQLMEYKGDWMNETRGALMMVATIIATVTFAAGVSPPGGVWQVDTTVSSKGPDGTEGSCTNDSVCYAGSAMLASYYSYDYIIYMKYNMISFISSLVVVFLLISGFPLSNKFCLWILSLDMCVTVSFLGLTFLKALWLVNPYELVEPYDKFKTVSYSVWRALVCIVGLCLLVRLSHWLRCIYKSTQFKST